MKPVLLILQKTNKIFENSPNRLVSQHSSPILPSKERLAPINTNDNKNEEMISSSQPNLSQSTNQDDNDITLTSSQQTNKRKRKPNREMQAEQLENKKQNKNETQKVRQIRNSQKVNTTEIPPSNDNNKNIVENESTNLIPPAEIIYDEVYYFTQYAEYLKSIIIEQQENQLNQNKNSKKRVVETTEDFCHLCKDGGELIECDYRRKSKHHSKYSRCKKVYHSYCLGYDVETNSRSKWLCLKHYCSLCGEINPPIECVYCPQSYCPGCFSTWCEGNQDLFYGKVIKKLETSSNSLENSNEGIAIEIEDQQSIQEKDSKKNKIITPTSSSSSITNSKVNLPSELSSIICGNCIRMIDRCKERGTWNSNPFPFELIKCQNELKKFTK